MRALTAWLLCWLASSALAFDAVNPTPPWYRYGTTSPGFTSMLDLAPTASGSCSLGGGYVLQEHVGAPGACAFSGDCPLNIGCTACTSGLECYRSSPASGPYTYFQTYRGPACATGTTATDGFCIPNVCITNQGKEADFEVTWIGSESDANPTGACVDGCEMSISSGARFDVTLAGGTRYNAYKGMGVMTTAACSAGSRTGNATTAYRAIASGGGNVSGTGGVGSSGGGTTTSGQGFNKTDAINLAKIATNTSQLTSGGITTSTVITSTNEGNTGTSDTNTQAAIAGEHGAVSSALDAGDAALAAAGTQSFLPGEGRWLFGLGGFFPAVAECSMDVGTVPMTTRADLHLVIDFCDKVGWAQDFMYWTFGLMTLMGIWSMLFASKESA